MMNSVLVLSLNMAGLVLLIIGIESQGTTDLCDERTCSSWNFAYAECTYNKAYVTISLTNKISKSACDRDTSFGLNETGIWVDQGCRGSFKVCECATTYEVDCNSWRYQYAECPVNNPCAIYSVRVAQKRSRSACVLGTSFGTNNQGLWVDKGCRARFEICRCTSTKLVNCDSNGFKYKECPIQAPNGILRVTVDYKRSSSACVFDDSFGIDQKGIWVDKGCRAAFDVCLN